MYQPLKKEAPKQQPIQKKDAKKPNYTGIPDTLKTKYENHSGFSFDDVRVHYNSDKPAQFQALAYTQGDQVYMAPRQEKHLEHELGHVVQQKQGIVKPTGRINNVAVNEDKGLERNADYIGNDMESNRAETDNQNATMQLKSIIQFTREAIIDLSKEEKDLTVLREHLELCKSQLKEIKIGEDINVRMYERDLEYCENIINNEKLTKKEKEEKIPLIRNRLIDVTDVLNTSFNIFNSKEKIKEKSEKERIKEKEDKKNRKLEKEQKKEMQIKAEDSKASIRRVKKFGKSDLIIKCNRDENVDTIWVLNDEKIPYDPSLNKTEQKKYEEWSASIKKNISPIDAAKNLGDANCTKMKNMGDTWHFRLNGEQRVYFTISEKCYKIKYLVENKKINENKKILEIIESLGILKSEKDKPRETINVKFINVSAIGSHQKKKKGK